MSPGEWIAAIGLVITLISGLIAGVWWMRALYGNLLFNGQEIRKNGSELVKLSKSMETHVRECDSDRLEIARILDDQGGRIVNLEGEGKD